MNNQHYNHITFKLRQPYPSTLHYSQYRSESSVQTQTSSTQVIIVGLCPTKIAKLKPSLTGLELFEYISLMTSINTSELRIVIDKKEIYPNREILPGLVKDCVINVRTRLLGGGYEGQRRQKKCIDERRPKAVQQEQEVNALQVVDYWDLLLKEYD